MGKSILQVHEKDLVAVLPHLPGGTVILRTEAHPAFIKPGLLIFVIEGPEVPDADEVVALITEIRAQRDQPQVMKVELEPVARPAPKRRFFSPLVDV